MLEVFLDQISPPSPILTIDGLEEVFKAALRLDIDSYVDCPVCSNTIKIYEIINSDVNIKIDYNCVDFLCMTPRDVFEVLIGMSH